MSSPNSLEMQEKLAKKIYKDPSTYDTVVKELTDKDKLIILSILESKLLSKMLKTTGNNQNEIAKQLR
jgi:hypothetical protein